MRDRLLADLQQPRDHLLPLAFVEVQLDHIAFEWWDPIQEGVEAIEEVGVLPPVGVTAEFIPGPGRSSVGTDIAVQVQV